MTELEVVETNVEPLDTVEFVPDGRTEYDSGSLTAVYPSDASTSEYVVAMFNVDSGTVDLPDDSVLLSVNSGTVVAAVPSEAYGGGA